MAGVVGDYFKCNAHVCGHMHCGVVGGQSDVEGNNLRVITLSPLLRGDSITSPLWTHSSSSYKHAII